MPNRAGLSGQNLGIEYIAYSYSDTKQALISYFTGTPVVSDPQFAGYALSDVLNIRLAEHDYSYSMTLFAAVEAALRVDYLDRVNRKLKDDLSRKFRDIHKEKNNRVSLEEDILDAWREHSGVDRQLIGDLKGAFKYRHWLAHGRYWTANLARPLAQYDYFSIYLLADDVMKSLNLGAYQQT